MYLKMHGRRKKNRPYEKDKDIESHHEQKQGMVRKRKDEKV